MTISNTDTFEKFYKNVQEALLKSNLIKKIDVTILRDSDIDYDIFKKFLETPRKIFIDEDSSRLYIEDESGDKIFAPEAELGVDYSSLWMEQYLPYPSFSIEQGGNVRRSIEAEAIYNVVVVNIVFDNIFSPQIDEILSSGYNFDTLSSSGGNNFTNLLTDIQDLQALDINCVLSACKRKLTSIKKIYEKSFERLLTQEDCTKLEDIDLLRREVNIEFGKSGRGTKDFGGLTRIEVLKIIEDRDNRLNKILKDFGNFGKLWRIKHLSSEHIPVVAKVKIRNLCSLEVDSIISTSKEPLEVWEVRNLLRRLIRFGYKAYLSDFKDSEINKFKQDPDSYIVPLKR